MPMKNAVKAVAFCLILLLCLNRLYDIFSWKDTAGNYVSSMNSFYELEEDVVDVLFLGSSRCYCSINNSILWEEQGIPSFSLSISGQDLASSYHCLVEALKTQTPEVVCLELFGTMFHGYLVDSNMYRNTLGYKMSKNAVEAVESIAPERSTELLLRWPIIHTRYKELQREDFVKNPPIYVGYQSNFNQQEQGALCTYFGDETEPIAEEEEAWLRKIIALAKDNDIKLCLFAAPFSSDEIAQKKLNYVKEIAQETNVDYLNMSRMEEELGLNPDRDFVDWMHTNHYGAQKVSSYMGSYLMQNYDLTDRSNEEGYVRWEEDSKLRTHEYQEQMLKQNYDMGSYLDFLASMDGYTLIIASNGAYKTSEASFDYYVDIFGLGGYHDASGIWMVESGQMIFQSVGGDMLEYRDLMRNNLALSSSQGKTNIVIDKLSYAKVDNGINIVVYDNVLEKVVDAVGLDATSQYAMKR